MKSDMPLSWLWKQHGSGGRIFLLVVREASMARARASLAKTLISVVTRELSIMHAH